MSLLRALARIWTLTLLCTALALTLAVAARMIIPRAPWAPAPALLTTSPPDGAAEVLPTASITLRFNVAMNRASVVEALRIEPPIPGALSWSDDATALTFRPAAGLTPGLSYSVSLDPRALSRWWRPLPTLARASFRTAPQPAVVAAMPTTVGAPLDTALALVFSQPMVAQELAGRPTALPQITLAPPIALGASWLDQRTLLLRPATPLAPATRYTATIGPSLADLRGIELGAPFSWSFTTGWPTIIERAPAHSARWVSPRAPLSLRLDAPLNLALLRQALQITPAITGELTSAQLGATQVITFTPSAGWSFGTRYSVALVEPPGSGLGAPPAAAWSFEVEPRPRLLAFFPGQGQLLAPGQPIRLVFSTPMDAATLSAGLRIEPAVDDLPISVSETEVRLSPSLRPSTLYTITLAPGTLDRSGEPLAAEVQVRLRTTPARPALAAPNAFDGLVTLPVSRTASIELATTNLSGLDLSLYQLDQPTLLRALALGPTQRRDFSPERYGQPLVRSWRVPRSVPLDQPASLTLPVGIVDGDPLAPGAYFLRAVSPEGPRSDLLVIVAAARLTLRQGPAESLLWATDSASGAPVPDLPVALYRGGALLARGSTGPDGTWLQPVPAAPAAPLLAIAEAGGPALVRGDWAAPLAAAPAISALVFPDQRSYAPGDTVRLTGLIRRSAPEGGLGLPTDDTLCGIKLRSGTGSSLATGSSCAIDPATGSLRGQISLPARLAPGDYQLDVQIGDLLRALPLRVELPQAPRRSLDLAVRPLPGALRVSVGDGGLPLASTPISWSLRLEPLAAPAPPDGYTLTPPPASQPVTIVGQSTTDASGAFDTGPFEGSPSPVARRYLLRVALLGGDAQPEGAELEGLLAPDLPLAALRLPSQLVASDRRSSVELLALSGLGQPAPGTRVSLQVFPVGATDGAPLLVRQAITASDGGASVQLVQLNPGEYELVAAAGAGPPTRARLWVYGARYAGWSAPEGQVAVIADRARYSPGDVATLLVAVPTAQANLLLTVERGSLLSAQARTLRAGQVITLPITADMAPSVNIGAVLTSGDSWRSGAATLAVTGGPAPLSVALATGQADYLPAATAMLTATTSAGAAPVAADLLVTIAPELASGLPPSSGGAALERPGPTGFTAATFPPANQAARLSELAPLASPNPAAPAVALELNTGAGSSDTVVTGLPLPAEAGRWRITAYASSGADQIAVGSTVVTTSLPLAYDLVGPPALRAGDRANFELLVRNTSPLTRELRVTLAATGLTLNPAAPNERRLTLSPGGAQRVSWEAVPRAGVERASLQLTIATPGLNRTLNRDLPVSAALAAPSAGVSFVASGPLTVTLDLPTPPIGALRIAIAPGLRAALTAQAEQLAARVEPSVEDQAALTLISAGLARPGNDDERALWEQRTRDALAGLDAAQNPDGGWGWWPATPSEPFVTAFALEAQVAARAALGDSRPPSLRAVAQLGRLAPAADPDTRAYIAYVLTRSGRAAPETAALLDAPLAADGLAFLALALPPSQAGPALDRLSALATRGSASPAVGATVRWPSDEPGGLPRGGAAVTAAAAQALAARRPNDPALPGATNSMLRAWGVDGWSSSYEAARVATALLGRASVAGDGPRRVVLAGRALLGDGTPISATLQAELPAANLGPRPVLSVQTSGADTYLVATSSHVAAPDPGGQLALAQELIDPNSGTPLDPATLRPGQLVAIRVTMIVPSQLLRAELELPLPGGLEPLPSPLNAPFIHSSSLSGRSRSLTLSAANLAPGVYSQRILVRAVAAGSFSAPPARITATYIAGLTATAPNSLSIIITP